MVDAAQFADANTPADMTDAALDAQYALLCQQWQQRPGDWTLRRRLDGLEAEFWIRARPAPVPTSEKGDPRAEGASQSRG